MDDQNKNLILATALSALVILAWVILFPPEQPVAPISDQATTASSTTSALPDEDAVAPTSNDGAVVTHPLKRRPLKPAKAHLVKPDGLRSKPTVSPVLSRSGVHCSMICL